MPIWSPSDCGADDHDVPQAKRPRQYVLIAARNEYTSMVMGGGNSLSQIGAESESDIVVNVFGPSSVQANEGQ